MAWLVRNFILFYFFPYLKCNEINPCRYFLKGNHGLSGESGGNVYVICNEMFNGDRWTISSQGGFGSNGQNGGQGKNGKDGENGASKWFKSDFNSEFPTMSKWSGSSSSLAVNTTLRTLERILPTDNRTYGKYKTSGGDRESFFIEGTRKNGGTITVSFECGARRHSLVLCQG
jgi:hypothetical protein